jgi:hypothetical protein
MMSANKVWQLKHMSGKKGKKNMKRIVVLLIVAVAMFAIVVPAFAAPPPKCATIQGGGLTDRNGYPITTGYDKWGYNYQAQMFNGFYGNYSRPVVPVTSGDKLEMKWNDAWLSNQDCDGSETPGYPGTKLDRHYGFLTYRGSGAWLTNHASGNYEYSGMTCSWRDFVKIVAVPTTATPLPDAIACPAANGLDGSMWYLDGKQIGCSIWTDFALIQEESSDPCGQQPIMDYKNKFRSGLGNW